MELVEDGERIRIDIPNRALELIVSDEELPARRDVLDGMRARDYARHASPASPTVAATKQD